jgi:hypothetical protein
MKVTGTFSLASCPSNKSSSDCVLFAASSSHPAVESVGKISL